MSAKSAFQVAAAGLAMAVFSLVPAAARTAACPVVDAYADFATLAAADDHGQAGFQTTFLPRYADLYTADAIGLPPGARLDGLARGALADTAGLARGRVSEAALRQAIPRITERFAAAFPDFRCGFPLYLVPSFGQMDGAGRQVAGKPSLVLGVDVISQTEPEAQLPVFLAHEFFHRYHDQASGFSDDLGARDLIWRSLWAEGLATYVSARLNPDRPLADAMLLPRDLEARAKPLVPALARELEANLDRVDARTYANFFLYYGEARSAQLGRPPRSGYYLGYRVAERLGRHRSLSQLAHLKGPSLRAEIGTALRALAEEGATLG